MRMQAASLLGQISQQSQQRHDELAPALARVQNTLAAALFDTPPETQYGRHGGDCLERMLAWTIPPPTMTQSCAWTTAGSLVGLMAFGVPVLLHLVMPKLQRYADMFQVGPIVSWCVSGFLC